MIEEIYPMPSFPILIARDLELSAKWYQDLLGFKHIFSMSGSDGQPTLVHLRWVKYADILIARPRDGKDLPAPKGVGISLNFSMFDRFDGDIDAFANPARQKGAHIVGPIDQPWNVREVTVFDPDGYELVFNVPLNVNLGFDEVIKRARRGSNE